MTEPRERPILFSGPMVRALLRKENPKRVTRRLVKPQPWRGHNLQPMWGTSPDGVEHGEKSLWREVGPDYPDGATNDRRCPYGEPEDRLWVRETWIAIDDGGIIQHRPSAFDGLTVLYAADDNTQHAERGFSWKRSIHMPRWASRLTLEVVSVRAERLQDITDEDARLEGMCLTEHPPLRQGSMSIDGGRIFHPLSLPRPGWSAVPGSPPETCMESARMAFANLWDKMNGWGSWSSNPWVWRIEFDLLEVRNA